jgi:GNAT superfamily N-acetyltransferase
LNLQKIRIAPACAGDTPLLIEFIQALAEYERAGPGEVQVNEPELRESLFGDRPAAEALIAYYGDTPAGFAVFFHNFSTWTGKRGMYLEDLFVKPKFRKAGIGRALLETVAKIAVERGCARYQWMVLDWNEPAIGFYKKLGARPLEEWTAFRVTGDALLKLARGGR